MKEIICPNCHTAFQVDENAYAAIISQIRTKEFNEELQERIKELRHQMKEGEENVRIRTEKEYEMRIADKDRKIGELNARMTEMKGMIESFNIRKDAEIIAVKATKDKQIMDALAEKDKCILQLETQLASKEKDFQIKLMESEGKGNALVQEKDMEIVELRSLLNTEKLSSEKREADLREQHKLQLRDKQDEIDRLKDFRLRLSTKMVGETLEQHCFIQYSQAKSMGQFPESTFEKDNTAVEGTKGDFIFRDYIDGNECLSIMFEMKNENDTTATKHKNTDFLEKLDNDRRKKGCEYAVLVSMLEQENEMYNNGIVDVSYIYPKMLVIRPQFFIPVLRLLSEASRKGQLEKRQILAELEAARSETRDFSVFEKRLEDFRTEFGKKVIQAHSRFEKATKGIDSCITELEKEIKRLKDIRAALISSDEKIIDSEGYVTDKLTVRHLTHGAPSVRKQIEEARRLEKSDD